MNLFTQRIIAFFLGIIFFISLALIGGAFDKNSECKKTDYWNEVEDCWAKGGEVYVYSHSKKAVCKYDSPEIKIYNLKQ